MARGGRHGEGGSGRGEERVRVVPPAALGRGPPSAGGEGGCGGSRGRSAGRRGGRSGAQPQVSAVRRLRTKWRRRPEGLSSGGPRRAACRVRERAEVTPRGELAPEKADQSVCFGRTVVVLHGAAEEPSRGPQVAF